MVYQKDMIEARKFHHRPTQVVLRSREQRRLLNFTRTLLDAKKGWSWDPGKPHQIPSGNLT